MKVILFNYLIRGIRTKTKREKTNIQKEKHALVLSIITSVSFFGLLPVPSLFPFTHISSIFLLYFLVSLIYARHSKIPFLNIHKCFLIYAPAILYNYNSRYGVQHAEHPVQAVHVQ